MYVICLCDVTLSVYPHRAGLKNMPGHGGIRTYDLWNTILAVCNITHASYSPEYIAPTQQISMYVMLHKTQENDKRSRNTHQR
jgi:hypothetical protein